jgi:hypothetical protein
MVALILGKGNLGGGGGGWPSPCPSLCLRSGGGDFFILDNFYIYGVMDLPNLVWGCPIM